MREPIVQQGSDFSLLLKRYEKLDKEETINLLLWLQSTYFFSKSAKEVFSVQGVW
jgi:hypothetical protein